MSPSSKRWPAPRRATCGSIRNSLLGWEHRPATSSSIWRLPLAPAACPCGDVSPQPRGWKKAREKKKYIMPLSLIICVCLCVDMCFTCMWATIMQSHMQLYSRMWISTMFTLFWCRQFGLFYSYMQGSARASHCRPTSRTLGNGSVAAACRVSSPQKTLRGMSSET